MKEAISAVPVAPPYRGPSNPQVAADLDIPFSRPFLTGNEQKYVAEAIGTGAIGSDGRYTRACASLLKQRFRIQDVFMVPSCTAALEMAAMLCGLAEGDEVILPSFTFTSTANAVILAGARPVFVDIRPDTLNMDESLIEACITRRTKAIVPVHYGGVSCDMDRIMAIANKHNLFVIEDAAQAVNATYGGRALGSIGHLGAYSFHSTKDYTCGEGGALCVNSPELSQRAEIIRDKGTNRGRYLRGEVDKYTWVDTGSSYVPSELNCAYLYAQLEKMDTIKLQRRRVFDSYQKNLRSYEKAELLRLPRVPDGCETNCHTFYTLLSSASLRDEALDHLRSKGIKASSHYVPLHCSVMGTRYGYRQGNFPVTEDLSARLLRLPLYPDLTDNQVMEISAILGEFVTTFQEPASGAVRAGHLRTATAPW